MKINHPNVTVLLDRHVTAINRRNKPKTFGINRIVPSKTTWKYPTVVHSGHYQGYDQDDQQPDRKVYFMVLATPLSGPVTDPGGDMHGVDVDGTAPEVNVGLPAQFQREGSVVSDVFGPTASSSRLETIDEDEPRTPGPTTCSVAKGKEKVVSSMPAKTPKTPKTPKPVEPTFTDLPGGDLTMEGAEQMFAMVKALAYHRESAKYEHQKKAYDEEVEPSPKDLDQYGWSKYMTMLFRPTFKIWWAPMVYRKYVKTARFHLKRRHSYFRRK